LKKLLPMHNRATSLIEARLGLLGLTLLLLLTGCPGSKGPRSWQGSDHAKVARYSYAGLRIAQRTEPRPYAHVELLFQRDSEAEQFSQHIEVLLATAIQGGSEDLSGPEFIMALERAGALVDLQVRPNHYAIRLRCLPEQLTPAFDAFAAVLLRPRFPEEVYARVLAQIGTPAPNGTTPAQHALRCLRAARATTAPIVEAPAQDRASALRVLREEVFVKCRMAITTVGPTDAEQLGDRLFNSLDQLPDGNCPPAAPQPTAWGRIVAQQLSGGVQHISGEMPGPAADHPDAFPAVATMHIINAWLQQRFIIGMHLLTAADARYQPGAAGQPGSLRIDLEGPKALQATELLLSEIRSLKADGIRPSLLDSARVGLSLDGSIGLETAAVMAEQIGAAIFADSWPNFGNPEARVAALRPAHIQHVLTTYATQVCWGYAGDTLRLDRKTLLRL
jgi:predicted Zn-dependent peptidase